MGIQQTNANFHKHQCVTFSESFLDDDMGQSLGHPPNLGMWYSITSYPTGHCQVLICELVLVPQSWEVDI
jgi:hypothetical protein